ncbi:hypothetical protein C8R46DRAFT_1138008 [Mycena filopes]|nr:hypothetical protein C8R46DRAFT_1138008 [Mycena filopes]
MSAFAHTPAFPPEISDLVIFELGGDLPTLRTCSQVCRVWLPASRHILHQTLKLRGEDLLEFADIIASADNTYFATLRALELSLCENGGPATAALLEILPKFISLKSVRVSASIFHFSLPLLPGVTTLEFKLTEFRSFGEFTYMLGHVPNLRNLKLQRVSWGSMRGWTSTEVDSAETSLTSIVRLELDTLHIELLPDELLGWLASEVSAPLTADLVLALPKDRYGDSINAVLLGTASGYLKFLGPRLKRLYLRFSGMPQLDQLNLSANPALQYLRLDFAYNRQGRHAQVDESWSRYLSTHLPSALERLRSGNIDEIVVDMNAVPTDKNMDIARLSAVLVSVPFSRLRRLQFNGQWDDVVAGHSKLTTRKAFTKSVVDKLSVASSCSIVLVEAP